MCDLNIHNLCKAFNGKVVLDHVNAVLPAGQITGLMAPSGAGKTTLLRILMGLEKADSGSIDHLAHRKLSAVFQEDRLVDHLDAVANIRLVNPQLPASQILEALEQFGLAEAARQPVRELSGGQKRRVALLRGILADFDFLILDEPFKGLDQKTKEAVMEKTRTACQGKTVLFVTHDPSELEAMQVSHTISLEPDSPL